jgi:hypothetical protein
MTSDPRPEVSLEPTAGWHVSHLYYRFDRARLRSLGTSELGDGCREFIAALDPAGPWSPARMQAVIVSGHGPTYGFAGAPAAGAFFGGTAAFSAGLTGFCLVTAATSAG